MNLLKKCHILLLLVLLNASSSVSAHSSEDLLDLQGLVKVFFESLLNSDIGIVEPILSSNFSEADRTYYQITVVNSEVDRSSLIDAVFHDNEDGSVTLGPIEHHGSVTDGSIGFDRILYNNVPMLEMRADATRQDNQILTFSIVFEKEMNVWKISGIQPLASDMLEEGSRASDQSAVIVQFSIRDDETGLPVGSRVHIQDDDGEYWPVDGHHRHIRLGSGQDVGGDVHIGNKTYAYVGPEFRADLPEGRYSIEIYHGMEYLPERLTFEVGGTSDEVISIALRRWINMREEGWYSGDTHTHFLSEKSALLEARGENLNVVNLLATKWGIYLDKWEQLVTDIGKFSGKQSFYSDENHLVYVNQESRHGFLGHATLHPLKRLIYPLSWGGLSRGGENVPSGFDYPPVAQLADEAHAQGAIVTAAHFPYPPGEIAIDVALGKIDSVDLFTFGDSFHNRTSTFHGLEMPTPVNLWYKFLNTGATLPVTGGTDKMRNVQVVGSVRTYVFLDNQLLTYENWAAGIKRGETFVTTGPMIWLTVDGEPIGSELDRSEGDEVVLKATIMSATPIKVLEIIMGGEVVAQIENLDNELKFTLEFTTSMADSTWFAARAYSPGTLDYQRFSLLTTRGIPLMAHTSPIYVSVDGAPTVSISDASFLIELCDLAINWVNTEARFQEPEHKTEMLALFEQAKAYYTQQVEKY